MTHTPIQEAIAYWTQRKKEIIEGDSGLNTQYDTLFIQYLESLLPKEKEFAEKCFDAGIDFSEGVDHPNKTVFINQLYPKP